MCFASFASFLTIMYGTQLQTDSFTEKSRNCWKNICFSLYKQGIECLLQWYTFLKTQEIPECLGHFLECTWSRNRQSMGEAGCSGYDHMSGAGFVLAEYVLLNRFRLTRACRRVGGKRGGSWAVNEEQRQDPPAILQATPSGPPQPNNGQAKSGGENYTDLWKWPQNCAKHVDALRTQTDMCVCVCVCSG